MTGTRRTRIAEWADLVDAEVPDRVLEATDADRPVEARRDREWDADPDELR